MWLDFMYRNLINILVIEIPACCHYYCNVLFVFLCAFARVHERLNTPGQDNAFIFEKITCFNEGNISAMFVFFMTLQLTIRWSVCYDASAGLLC